MLRHVALVRTDISQELSVSTVVLTRTTQRNIQEDSILHSHRRENLKSYKSYTTYFIPKCKSYFFLP
jgi:hypothetical protein